MSNPEANRLVYKLVQPPVELEPFVESYWMLISRSHQEQDIVVLPDGRIDLIAVRSNKQPFQVALLGLEIGASQATLEPGCIMFAVSFRLLAVEYLFKTSVAHLLNDGELLPANQWGLSEEDLQDFDRFCQKMSSRIQEQLTEQPDSRKRELFRLIYSSHGEIAVKQLADQVYWSSRQINRYFNKQFGLSLKAYCSILRFRAAFPQIRQGKLFPGLSFVDQAHFIKEVKKFAGVTPRTLYKNQNDRFIQFTTLPPE